MSRNTRKNVGFYPGGIPRGTSAEILRGTLKDFFGETMGLPGETFEYDERGKTQKFREEF